MRIDDILDETIELIIANMNGGSFKDIGALRKSQYQHSKGEEDSFLRSDMYKGTLAASEASKKAKKDGRCGKTYSKESIEKGRQTRANWYKDPKNRVNFAKKIKQRDKNKKASNQST